MMKHLRAIFTLPFSATVLIPYGLWLLSQKYGLGPLIDAEFYPFFNLIGKVFILIGLVLFISTFILFIRIGKGTIAPWDPTKKLIVRGPYCYLRNPMISGVFLIIVGEAFIFNNKLLFLWSTLFILINIIYMQLVEEPDLMKKFGDEYKEYKKNVPAWLPRISSWSPDNVS